MKLGWCRQFAYLSAALKLWKGDEMYEFKGRDGTVLLVPASKINLEG